VPVPTPAPAAAANTAGGIRGFTSGLVQKLTPGGSNGKKTSDAEVGETARITALQTTGSGMAVITLDNGQQWRQQESVAYFPLAIGDTVRVEKGALGSFRLTRVEEGWKTFMRVSRTK
jgi:Lon protease-like protein